MEGMDRRKFLTGAVIAGTAGALGILGGCAPQQKPEGGNAGETTPAAEQATYDVVETKEVDVVVVGAGIAGLASAVEAAENGAKTLLIEKMDTLGGNGVFTYGPCGFNTKYSKASGIELDYHEVMTEELELFNYKQNIRFFTDMAEASSDNIDWVAAHGVPFLDVVDVYKGGHPTMHYWAGEGEHDAANRVSYGGNYAKGMGAAAEKAGVEILTNTPAVDIIADGSTVTGVIAQNKDGQYLQINAHSVILATGGWCASKDYMKAAGRNNEAVNTYKFAQGQTGDGYRLATKAGAFDLSGNVGYVEQPGFAEMALAEANVKKAGATDNSQFPNKNDNHPVWQFLKHGKGIWINEEGERFANEACGRPDGGVAGWATNAIISQQRSYALLDKAIAEELGQDCIDFVMGANEMNTKFRANTLEELAKVADINTEKLVATIERYNSLCAAGRDDDFGKEGSNFAPIGEGPYYAVQLGVTMLCSTGGVRVNRSMQAVDGDWNPISGLYVIGVDSFPFYSQMYYYQLPGSAVGYELHSGLTAARHATGKLS